MSTASGEPGESPTHSDAARPEGSPRDLDAIQADIEQTREELGQTVDALAAKLDVKARTRARVTEGKQRAVDQFESARMQAAQVATRVRDQVVDDDGAPRREVVIAAVGLLVSLSTVAVLVTWWRRR